MECRDKVRDIFSYLLSVKNINEKITRDINEYEKVYWESDLNKLNGCNVSSEFGNDWYIQVGKKSKSLYEQLFKLYLDMEKMGEKLEIIWGHGLITWKLRDGKIMHPIFSTNIKLEFDCKNSIFTLVPGSKTKVETDIFDGIDVSNLDDILDIEARLNSMAIDPRNMKNLRGILWELAIALNSNGKVEIQDTSKDNVQVNDIPIIYNSSVIFVRKNNVRLWHQEIKSIIDKINKGCVIPNTLKALVEDNKIEPTNHENKVWGQVGSNLLFPLPANNQQKEIVKRLCENYGVVVQGPPGTGKSHTIINLICHLLAHGKRVLVTSQTSRALRVLSEKVPDEIKPLCMSVLGNDIDSMKYLDDSVRKITDNLSIEPDSLLKDIKELEDELNQCKKTQNTLLEKFKKIEKIENDAIAYNGNYYKIIDIAKWTKENVKHSWVKDKIGIREKMCLTEREFDRLKNMTNSIDQKDKKLIDRLSLILDKIPMEEDLCEKITKFKALKEKNNNLKEKITGWRVPENNRCDYDKVIAVLYQCKEQLKNIEDSGLSCILKNYYNSKIAHNAFMDLYYRCSEYLTVLTKIRNDLRTHTVQVPISKDFSNFSDDFPILYNHLNNKGKLSKIFKVLHSECSYILKECKVDGKMIDNIDQALIVKLYIQEKTVLKNLKDLWNSTVKDYGAKVVDGDSNIIDIVSLENYVDKISTIVKWDETKKIEILSLMGKISTPDNLDWHKSSTYDYLIDCIKAIKYIEEFNALKAYMDVVKKLVLTTGEFKEFYVALEKLDENEIKINVSKIERLKLIKNQLDDVYRLLERLKDVCPNTVKSIEKDWNSYMNLCDSWRYCWKWAQWNKLIEDVYVLDIDDLEEQIEQEKNREKILIREIVAKRTWYSQIAKTSESQKRSLFAWMQAVKRIGKGTGKMVSEYRKIAQDEMEKCKEIIPVWIMPLNRVIENIKLSEKLFDVIIFDESSQSNIFSICALMRAKRAVIVGDDKQISPETVGIDQGLVQGIIKSHLRNIPQNEWFDLQTSLYETALRVFPNRLMLREHFRCVPQIIGFSNELSYFGEIKPLRYARVEESFTNPIVTVKVKNGLREQNKQVNVAESEALVNKLVECCRDSKYSGMTMGVISLLGEAQSEFIEGMIKERIGEEEMIRRRIVCGDAYSFQGDERDVMFLSLVISDNVKFNSLTKASDIRRFNVAASRARNQMWLFHSVDISSLSTECIRYSLLNYCLNYEKYNNKDKNVEYVFQSQFQKDVYNMLLKKGYFVNPQVKISKYKLDFIIQGKTSRAAILCDGDNFAANPNWEENIEMQLNLERLGWTICRIRGGEFYYDTEKTMEKLINKLRKIGIEESIQMKLLGENLKVV